MNYKGWREVLIFYKNENFSIFEAGIRRTIRKIRYADETERIFKFLFSSDFIFELAPKSNDYGLMFLNELIINYPDLKVGVRQIAEI